MKHLTHEYHMCIMKWDIPLYHLFPMNTVYCSMSRMKLWPRYTHHSFNVKPSIFLIHDLLEKRCTWNHLGIVSCVNSGDQWTWEIDKMKSSFYFTPRSIPFVPRHAKRSLMAWVIQPCIHNRFFLPLALSLVKGTTRGMSGVYLPLVMNPLCSLKGYHARSITCLWWDCCSVTRFTSMAKMSFMDPPWWP